VTGSDGSEPEEVLGPKHEVVDLMTSLRHELAPFPKEQSWICATSERVALTRWFTKFVGIYCHVEDEHIERQPELWLEPTPWPR
jgi:hypothetical protein